MALAVDITQRGASTRLADVTCSLGRFNKPYPEQHEHGMWTVALVRRGTFAYRSSSSARTEVRPGWLLLGREGDAFECSHDHDGGDECASFALDACIIHEANVALPSRALPPSTRIASLIERARRGGVDLDEVGCAIAEALAAHANGSSLPDASRAGDVDRVRAAMERIECSCDEPLALADLAAEVGWSQFHFLRTFRRVTGTTPHQYLLAARLRLATRLLLDTDRPITQIAYEAGFQDLSNFVRTFHRTTGKSPRAYRSL
jgi:AraC-like DNA-binding protein